MVNAAVALGVPLADLAAPADSVAISLNKSLSAPFGAVLAGSDAVVGRARTMLHRLGGSSFHRAGIAAAAGLVALDTMLDHVADDHRRARALAAGLAAIPGVRLRPEVIETNIVLADVSDTGIAPPELVSLLAGAGLRVLERDTSRIRLVTHRLIGDDEIEHAVAILTETVARHAVSLLEVPELDDSWEAELALEDD
jgi:threonine aldolase